MFKFLSCILLYKYIYVTLYEKFFFFLDWVNYCTYVYAQNVTLKQLHVQVTGLFVQLRNIFC